MIRNIITAIAGKKVAEKMGGGAAGAAAVAALPFIAKRGLGPLGAALTAGWVAKKALDWRRRAKARDVAYPDGAAPVATPPAQTATP
ncbi:hypothetical protein WJT74_00890 [Sphingomicrobium sp. XHP0239]|uniref:hypothetical protein n=1 Tax=Sphingomicrobium maritimum TaxID=3133972 RepID=UPI0031CC7281